MLDAMAAIKLNVLHWHLTDAHSFPFGSASQPQLPQRGALHPSLVYSPDQMRAVVAAAWQRGIRVVPELDMPGHTAAWGLAAPELVVGRVEPEPNPNPNPELVGVRVEP